MGFYLGNDRIKINLNGIVYCLNMLYKQPIRLISSDGYMLKSSDDFYLTVLDTGISEFAVSSSDGYILKDSNGLYLTVKESE